MSRILEAFVEHEKSIRRIFARYYSSAEDVEELTQETFLKVFSANMKTAVQEPKAFFLVVAKHLALSGLKRKAHSTTDYIEDSGGIEVLRDEGQTSIEEQVDWQNKLVIMSKAIASMPPEYQRALLMRKVEQLKLKQIAKRLDVSVSTIEKRVARALVMCNTYLRDHGYDPLEFAIKSNEMKVTNKVKSDKEISVVPISSSTHETKPK